MIQQPWFVHTPIVCKKAPGSLIIFIANRLSRASLFIMIANYLNAHTFLKRPKLPIKLLVLQARLEKKCLRKNWLYRRKERPWFGEAEISRQEMRNLSSSPFITTLPGIKLYLIERV